MKLAYIYAVLGNILWYLISNLLDYCFWFVITQALLVLRLYLLAVTTFIRTLGSLLLTAVHSLVLNVIAETNAYINNYIIVYWHYFCAIFHAYEWQIFSALTVVTLFILYVLFILYYIIF